MTGGPTVVRSECQHGGHADTERLHGHHADIRGQGLTGTVVVVEDMLEFGIATLDLPGVDGRVVAQVEDGSGLASGDTVTVTAPAGRVHLFDRESGKAIR